MIFKWIGSTVNLAVNYTHDQFALPSPMGCVCWVWGRKGTKHGSPTKRCIFLMAWKHYYYQSYKKFPTFYYL